MSIERNKIQNIISDIFWKEIDSPMYRNIRPNSYEWYYLCVGDIMMSFRNYFTLS